MSEKPKKPPRWLLPVVVIVCVGLAMWAFATAYGEWRLSHANVKTTCIVISAQRESSKEDSRNGSRAVVTISHEVDGKRYERTDVSGWAPDETIISDLTDYRVNDKVACRYVAGHPEIVIALWRRGESPVFYVIGGSALLLFAAVMYALERRKKLFTRGA
jgi:hypothetical protein